MRARATAMLAVIATMGVVACTVMTGLHTDPPVAAPAPPAGSCVLARPPPPPTTPGAPDDAKNDLLVAFQHVSVGPDDGWDLDGVCTCAPSPDSCLNDSGALHCDSVGGRDNAGAKLLGTLKGLGQFDAIDYLNERLTNGISGYLVKVEGYNGEPNDPSVKVAFYHSFGPRQTFPDGGFFPRPPVFSEVEAWSVRTIYLKEPKASLVSMFGGEGYVANDVLVVNLDELAFPVLPGEDTRFHGSLFTAQIVRGPDGKPTIRGGTLATRWAASDLLRALLRAYNGVATKPFCLLPGFARTAKDFVCPATDIAALPANDGKGSPCNALSLGLAFTTVDARIGELVDEEPPEDLCGDAAYASCDP